MKTKQSKNTESNQETNNHHIIIRHFKTKNDKIDYNKCYDEAKPYVKFIKTYVEKYGIYEIELRTSSYERTLMTSLIIYITLKDYLPHLVIEKPKIYKYLERQTNKLKQKEVINHFKKHNLTNNKLVINITHSSIYLKVFTGLIMGLSEENIDIDKLIQERHIHSHSLSYLTDINDEVKYSFNIKME